MQLPVSTAGIDVSKAALDVYARTSRAARRFRNTPAGCRALCAWLRARGVARVAFEPTGGYERRLREALHRAGIPAWQVNPRSVRRYAEGIGQLAKSDPLDAKLLADYATLDRFRECPPPDPARDALRALLRLRRAFVVQRVRIGNELEHLTGELRPLLRREQRRLERLIAGLERRIAERLAADAALREREALLASIPGVGVLSATTLLTELPELGRVNRRVIARLAGVAPLRNQSGTREGHAHTRDGRAQARSALYMAALAGTRCNAPLKALYARLTGKGRPAKLALTACMHKLLTIMNAVLRSQSPWGQVPT